MVKDWEAFNRLENKKFNRILQIFERLMKGEVIAKNVEAERFGVSPKSIQRDIKDLMNYLADTCSDEGDTEILYDRERKGYYLCRNQHQWLSNQEILALTKVLLESRAFNENEMNQLLDKLAMQSFPPERDHIKELIRNERFYYQHPQHQKDLLDLIWDAAAAVREQLQAEITYTKIREDQVVQRQILPQGLVFSEYYFYLIAYIKGSDYKYPAIYRLDRIQDLHISKDHFPVPDGKRFEEGKLRQRIQFMQAGELMTIRFRYWGLSLEAVMDRLPTAHIIKKDGNSTIVEAEIFGEGIKMWLLSQAQYLEVLKPERLREEMKRTIAAMADIYT